MGERLLVPIGDDFARHVGLREATPTDVAAWLAAHSGQVAEVRVALPWEPNRYYLGDRHGEPTDDGMETRKGLDSLYVASIGRRSDGRWDWWYFGKPDKWRLPNDSKATADEARAAADAGLTHGDQHWALAGGPRGR